MTIRTVLLRSGLLFLFASAFALSPAGAADPTASKADCGCTGKAKMPWAAFHSAPQDKGPYVRPLVKEDFLIDRMTNARVRNSLSPFLRDVALGIAVGFGNEPSIAVDPANTNHIVVTTFAGGWGPGSPAPTWISEDGGLNWTIQGTINMPPGIASGGPNDQTIDFGLNNVLFGTFLSCSGNPSFCSLYSGAQMDRIVPAATQFFTVGGIAKMTNNAVAANSVDQPWILMNRDPSNAAQMNAYVGYDDFTAGKIRVAAALGAGGIPPNFTRDAVVGSMGCCVNPGTRLAVDRNSGAVYCIWGFGNGEGPSPDAAKRAAPQASVNLDYMINRSLDGGQTWALNGSPTGISVANANSEQPTPKFGTVNALLGNIDHAAVDPRTGDVYYVYGTMDQSGNNRLAVRRLANDGVGGMTIGAENFVADAPVQAALPAAAVASNGVLGVLYMTFDGFSSTPDPTTPTQTLPIFSAHLARSMDKGLTFDEETLLTFLSPTIDNGDGRQRIMGDYHMLKTVGRYFYGVFPGNGANFGQPASGIDAIFFKAFAGGPIINLDPRTLDFGLACTGSPQTKTFEVFNTGSTDLHVMSITKQVGPSSAEFDLLPTPAPPLVIDPASHISFTVRHTPTATAGVKQATFRLMTDDPDWPTTDVVVTARDALPAIQVSPGIIRFDQVCANALGAAQQVTYICNIGECRGTIPPGGIHFQPPTSDFQIVGPPAGPVVLDPGSECFPITIRFTPTAMGTRAATLVVETAEGVTASAGVIGNVADVSVGSLRVTPKIAFPPTVVSRIGPCGSEKALEIVNANAACGIEVTTVTVKGLDAGAFSVVGFNDPSMFPVTLMPGEQLGDGALKVRFSPAELKTTRFLRATVEVGFVVDPTATPPIEKIIQVPVMGEAVQTGMRVVATFNNMPLLNIDAIRVRGPYLDQTWRNLPLKNVIAPSPFQNDLRFKYHAEFGGISAPNQRLMGTYQVTVYIRYANRTISRSVSFSADTCTFNPQLKINF